jgi:ubiquinone/menaquinone biosynthesis C-methylase UbiE
MDNVKEVIKEKYTALASLNRELSATNCCSNQTCCTDGGTTDFSESYDDIEGYAPQANMGLGCGLPTQYAGIKAGDIVLDLGSGAGNDCFVARTIVGEQGYVAGIDFTEAMVEKARSNAHALGYSNVDFIVGDIENLPVNHSMVDVIISNCVLNLVPDKQKAFSEIYRVLKPGGHFCISDVVLQGQLPEEMQNDSALYAGCVAGALQLADYLEVVKKSGFQDIVLHTQKAIDLPEEIVNRYTSALPPNPTGDATHGIFSITLSASKPEGCGCCGCGC